MIRHGRCLCGSVAFTARSRTRKAHECHCSQCRRWSGHVWAYVTLPWDALDFSGDADLRWYDHTPKARRGFCGTCGATLFWRQNGSAKVDVSAGAFDMPTGWTLGAPSFGGDKGDYYRL
ncbi:GFA family protein [Paracoccus laeviglucosivorans]|uniref:Uncharacterized conserved protein n=1 Tax=Paracoccus laeviglucosivorans TaxID=1197861 RepID=A0A521DKP2_9RHOB|nr:GFA family protein [Paracoccus laeviglucosivorans]SMO72304.1 Uncharacterized conserved protein [Paracoccus laeviglucosivorans]